MPDSADPETQKSTPTTSGKLPKRMVPGPMGTPEERSAWADQVVEQTVQNMRNLPKDYITPY